MAEFQRPKDAFRFAFGGLYTRDTPDSTPPEKYVIAQNVRSTGASSIKTRPGYVPAFIAGNAGITDIRGYTGQGNNSYVGAPNAFTPRLLARDGNGGVWLDTGSQVASMNAPTGLGASMIPFRPTESPATWMYIGDDGDYIKVSAPNANNNVTVQKVGIAEPQVQVNAAPKFQGSYIFTNTANNWANAGTAGSPSDGNRSVDTSGAVLTDPVDSTRQSVQVGNNSNSTYAIGEIVKFGNNSTQVVDVIPALAGNNITIKAIRYSSGNSGTCVIVPSQISFDSNVNSVDFLGALRRGAILQVASEAVFVRGVVVGPTGDISIETSTAGTYSAGNNLTGLPAIILYSIGANNSSVVSPMISANIGTGIGMLTQALAASPFSTSWPAPIPGNNAVAQQEDYVHLSVLFSDASQLTQMLIMFSVNAANNYTGDLYYYAVRPGDLVNIVNGNTTLLPAILQAATDQVIGSLETGYTAPDPSIAGNNQWTEIMLPVSALTRLGGDQSKSLKDCRSCQIQVNANNNISMSFGGLWIGGGGQPDVGNNGAPYRYAAVPLSSLTGVRGNPTPLMRYGVMPRRQPVLLKTSSLNSSYDPQIDTWEIYRYGGSLTSYRFIGTTPTGSDYVDNVFDDAAIAGREMQTDNTEPWPSIDIPWEVTSGITAYGQFLIVTGSSFPGTINRWLPGTIFQVGGQQAYVLRARPTAISGGYLFEFEECIGYGSQSRVFVLEPNVARQTLPYLWGPDEFGSVFAVGDPLRPGVVSWSKEYSPDAAPTKNTLELCPPSEPLLGGRSLSAVSLVASSKRWWMLTFQQGSIPEYSKMEVAIGKRLASAYGMDSDGALLYFWATDGICVTSASGPAKSLTDDDLYNLFPHGGLTGRDVTRFGVTFYAPDYSRAERFRLAVREGILNAVYEDSQGITHVLTYQISRGAWISDVYADPISVAYAIEQPDAPPTQQYPAVIFGDKNGRVWQVQDRHNDGDVPITAVVAPFEWDGGDLRMSELWGDLFLDCLPLSQISATPVSNGTPVGNATLVPSGPRSFPVISIGGGTLQNFISLLLVWTDDFSVQSQPSQLYAWQPSFAVQVETIQDRFSDWTDVGTPANKFFQGVLIDADTFGVDKTIIIQDADTGQGHVLQPAPVNHNGRKTLPYSFATPFLAHSVRDITTDQVPWRRFGIQYVFQATPEAVETWITQWTALGGKGYQHIPRIEASYASAAPVTLAIQSYDGTSPQPIVLPVTGGQTRRVLLTLTLNKGQLYRFSATSSLPFQMFLDDFIIWRGQWGRNAQYESYRNLGGTFGDRAEI